MNRTASVAIHPQGWTPRVRLYLIALGVTACYYTIAQLNYGTLTPTQIDLPLSCLTILLLGIAVAEACLFVQRARRYQAELDSTRARELELQQHLSVQRHQIFNHISRVLLDKLDINQVSHEVFEAMTQLFEADLVALWLVDKQNSEQFTCRSMFGLNGHSIESVTGVAWSFPQYGNGAKEFPQILLPQAAAGVTSSLLTFCDLENVQSLALTPIVRQNALVGLVGVFYRKPTQFPAALAEEMQTVANLIAGAVQAEELYHDLVRMQKIESVGTLASGIAHDFNNVLAAVLACATYCKQHTDPASQSYRYLEATEASAHRGAALTKRLLSFVRREEPKLRVINANDHIDHTMKMLESSLDKSILIQRQYAQNLRPVEADPSMLEQVILNIAVNARDAMPEGGFFTITTKNINLHKDNFHRPAVPLPDGDYVVLGFRDTGKGMDAATQKRIFEPFFTTKHPGQGTGLGLSLILNIVHNFGGEICLKSDLGIGTTFDIYLPASTKPLPETNAPVASAVRGGAECILLAEDEEIIREMAQRELEDKGYMVLTANDGAAALARYREDWQKINLVIVDMAMPRLSGPELFEAMKKINPGVRVIVSSGYSHDQEGQRMLRHGCLGFLQKPYSGDQLCSAIRAILDSGL